MKVRQKDRQTEEVRHRADRQTDGENENQRHMREERDGQKMGERKKRRKRSELKKQKQRHTKKVGEKETEKIIERKQTDMKDNREKNRYTRRCRQTGLGHLKRSPFTRWVFSIDVLEVPPRLQADVVRGLEPAISKQQQGRRPPG